MAGAFTLSRIPNPPVFPDLKSLFDRTDSCFAAALEPFGDKIQFAFLYGSIARSEEESESDIDLLIVGNIGLADLVPAMRQAEQVLGRAVNPTIFLDQEFSRIDRPRQFWTS